MWEALEMSAADRVAPPKGSLGTSMRIQTRLRIVADDPKLEVNVHGRRPASENCRDYDRQTIRLGSLRLFYLPPFLLLPFAEAIIAVDGAWT